MNDPPQLHRETLGARFVKVLLGRVIGLDMSRPSGLLTEQGRVEKLIRIPDDQLYIVTPLTP